MRDPRERLRDILEAIPAIERHLHRGKAAFEQNELLQGWCVRNLQTIGEAARALPQDVHTLALRNQMTQHHRNANRVGSQMLQYRRRYCLGCRHRWQSEGAWTWRVSGSLGK